MIKESLQLATESLGLKLADNVPSALEEYAAELLKWNRKINLTAITDEQEVAIKHFADALYLTRYVESGKTVLDIGSGAGIPSIPLAVACPDANFVSVDAVAKKIQFQKHAARVLGLENLEAIHARVEQLTQRYARKFDIITSRAFSSLGLFIKLARPLLAEGGVMIAMKGPATDTEIEASNIAMMDSGFHILDVIRYDLPKNYGKRCLIFIKACNH